MFKDLYPTIYRAAKAQMEARRNREATAPTADEGLPTTAGADAAQAMPLRLTIELPTEGVSELAIRLVRSGRSLTATLDLDEGSRPRANLEGSP